MKTNHQKLFDQFRIIGDIPPQISNTISEHENEYGAHTLFKLAFLNYYMGIFLPIAKSKTSKILFIDLLAGSGLVKIKERECYVKGSALLAATSRHSFSKILCCELNETRADLLRSRLNILKVPNDVIQGDVNNNIDIILRGNRIDKQTYVLLFIDPEGMEVKLEILKQIVELTDHVDIMLNYNYGINRMKGRAEAYRREVDIEKIRDMAPGYNLGAEPSELTIDFLEQDLGRKAGKRVDICRNTGQPEYSLIIRTRQTYKGSKWLEPMNPIIDYINQCDGKDAYALLDQVCGRSKSLDMFQSS